MTPAITAASQASINFTVHEYKHQASCKSYGEEAANALGIDPNQVFKTLVVKTSESWLAVAVLPVAKQLNMKSMAKALGVKKVEMANANDVQRSSGYVLGGVSPLGQKQALSTVVDNSAEDFKSIYVSAGKRGLELELAAQDLAKISKAKFSRLT